MVNVLHHGRKEADKQYAQGALDKEQDKVAGDTGIKFEIGRDPHESILFCKTVGEDKQATRIKQSRQTGASD